MNMRLPSFLGGPLQPPQAVSERLLTPHQKAETSEGAADRLVVLDHAGHEIDRSVFAMAPVVAQRVLAGLQGMDNDQAPAAPLPVTTPQDALAAAAMAGRTESDGVTLVDTGATFATDGLEYAAANDNGLAAYNDGRHEAIDRRVQPKVVAHDTYVAGIADAPPAAATAYEPLPPMSMPADVPTAEQALANAASMQAAARAAAYQAYVDTGAR